MTYKKGYIVKIGIGLYVNNTGVVGSTLTIIIIKMDTADGSSIYTII